MESVIKRLFLEIALPPTHARYYLKAFMKHTFLTSIIFLGVFSIFKIINTTIDFQEEGIATLTSFGIAAAQQAGRQFLLFLPLICTIGVMSALYQSIVKSEFIASSSLGMTISQLLKMIFYYAIFWITLSIVISEWVVPWSYQKLEQERLQLQEIQSTRSNQYIWLKQSYGMAGFFHYGKTDEIAKIKKVVLSNNMVSAIILAQSASYDKDSNSWLFKVVTQYNPNEITAVSSEFMRVSEDEFIKTSFISVMTTPPYGLSIIALIGTSFELFKNSVYPYSQVTEIVARMMQFATIILLAWMAGLAMVRTMNSRQSRGGLVSKMGKVFALALSIVLVQYAIKESLQTIAAYFIAQLFLQMAVFALLRNWYNKA